MLSWLGRTGGEIVIVNEVFDGTDMIGQFL